MRRTLDDVIHWVSKAAALPDADLDKDILHYLMMYRWLLRQQADPNNAECGIRNAELKKEE